MRLRQIGRGEALAILVGSRRDHPPGAKCSLSSSEAHAALNDQSEIGSRCVWGAQDQSRKLQAVLLTGSPRGQAALRRWVAGGPCEWVAC
jgi:hypothetical protein